MARSNAGEVAQAESNFDPSVVRAISVGQAATAEYDAAFGFDVGLAMRQRNAAR